MTPLRRAHKYSAIATEVNGIRFHSRKESRRYQELLLLEKAGEIRDLELQPKFELYVPVLLGSIAGRVPVGSYIADFRYRSGPKGLLVIEDVKSTPTKTALYRLKKKMVEATYNIVITEV